MTYTLTYKGLDYIIGSLTDYNNYIDTVNRLNKWKFKLDYPCLSVNERLNLILIEYMGYTEADIIKLEQEALELP